MDFYGRKQYATKIIDKMIVDPSFTKLDIIKTVTRETGLGRKFVEEYLGE